MYSATASSLLVILSTFEILSYAYSPTISSSLNRAGFHYSISQAFLIIGITNGLVWSAWTIFIYPLFFSPLRHLPKPPHASLIFGNGHAIFSKPPASELLTWAETVPHDGLIYFRTFFNQDVLLPIGPQALADVLQKNSYDFEKPARLRAFLGRVQGDGLSVVEGTQHKFQRKNMNPAFRLRQIKNLYPLFWEKSRALIVAVKAALGSSSSGEVEMGEWASRASMDIIGIAALGKDLDTLGDASHPVMVHFKDLFEFTPEAVVYFAANMILPSSVVAWLPMFSKSKRTMISGIDFLRRAGRDMVQEKRSQLSNKALGEDEKPDILSVILQTELFTDENTVDQLITFLAAGHETTANALTWVCHLLAIHSDIQEKLREEIKAAITSLDAEADAEKLDTMPLLHGVISESLRLFPGAPILLRESMRPTTIQRQYVPRGTQVVLSPWLVNRCSAIWGDKATEFRPGRWIDGEDSTATCNNHGGVANNYAFLTFLQGPRRCIGENFSRSELRCMVSAMVGSFRIEMANDDAPVIPAGIVGLKARDGMHLRLTALPRWAATEV